MSRILIIDGSRVFRTGLAELLEKTQGAKVVGSVHSVARGLKRIARGDVETVFVDMWTPDMSALAFLRRWRLLPKPKPTVWVFEGEERKSSANRLEAVALGAAGVLPKPRTSIERESLRATLQQEFVRTHGAVRSAPMALPRRAVGTPKRGVELLAVVSSTGGPAALVSLIRQLDPTNPTPVALVQHTLPDFVESLCRNLSRETGRSVHPAKDGEVLENGKIVVAPASCHLRLVRGPESIRCRLIDAPPEGGCRPSGNVLLRSAAEATNGRMIGVCLTGMGCDGADGMLSVKRAGGLVVAQDEQTSVVWGMPRAVVELGIADHVLPLQDIGKAIFAQCLRAAV